MGKKSVGPVAVLAGSEDCEDIARDERDASSFAEEGVGAPPDRLFSAIVSAHGRRAVQQLSELSWFPTVFVFDLDDTLWEGDIEMTSGPPFTCNNNKDIRSKRGDGVHLFRDVPEIFAWLDAQGFRGAVASHTATPRWAEASLQLIRAAGNGRNLSVLMPFKEMHGGCKSGHLKRLASLAGCDPSEMVFFDNMKYNVDDGRRAGVPSCFTPDGLTWEKFLQCCQEYNHLASQRSGHRPEQS